VKTKTPPLANVQLGIKLIGATAVVGYWVSAGTQPFRGYWFVAILIVAIETAATFQPFVVNHNGTRDTLTADMMVMVAVALLLPTSVGALALPCGFALGCILRDKKLDFARLDDVTSQIISTYLALTVGHLIGAPGLGMNSIAGAVIAAIAYDLLGSLMFTIKHVLLRRAGFWPFFRAGLASSVITWPWLICLGILIGVIGWDAPWALLLMGAPLALVFMASRSRVEATEDRVRLDGLLKATTEILASTTIDGVTAAATSSISMLFETYNGRIDANGPTESELGVPLHSERMPHRYLMVPARPAFVNAYTENDRRLLETLASVTASALDKAALHEDVTEQATRDALTGLANRRAFETALQSSTPGKRSTDASGVMFLDLDGFKKINDEHGHKAGDEVLVETARRLLGSVRDGDTVARLGGDEFTVLLRGMHGKDEARVVAERILEAMRQPITLSTGVDVHPTPSLGIALATVHDSDPGSLLKEADTAMYEAKRAGKDRWCFAGDDIAAAI
jgi:diguanylate cyclase (GGDEF)-like protein